MRLLFPLSPWRGAGGEAFFLIRHQIIPIEVVVPVGMTEHRSKGRAAVVVIGILAHLRKEVRERLFDIIRQGQKRSVYTIHLPKEQAGFLEVGGYAVVITLLPPFLEQRPKGIGVLTDEIAHYRQLKSSFRTFSDAGMCIEQEALHYPIVLSHDIR